MMHGLNNDFLYTAKKVVAHWSDGTTVAELRGTGFFIQKDANIFFITNRHVVEPGYSDAEYKGFKMVDFSVESYETFDVSGLPSTLKSASVANWNEFKFHPNEHNDVACLKDLKTVGGMTINAPVPFSMIATDEWITQKLSVCDSIAYPGFPEWYDRQNNTPVFRMGTIASDPRMNYSYMPGAPVASRIAYEGFSTGGASGSPVFAIQRGFKTGGAISASEDFYREVKLIGINAGHFLDQKGHSGISYLYKSSTIHDIIDNM
jgi:hypothetical protein